MEDELLTTDLLRGLLLLGFVGAAGYVVWRLYQKSKAEEAQRAAAPSKISVPIQLPTPKRKR